jgi:hypothetical protein
MIVASAKYVWKGGSQVFTVEFKLVQDGKVGYLV